MRFVVIDLTSHPLSRKTLYGHRPSGVAMRMRVREEGDEVHIELTGIAGRQQRVLQALNECQRAACGCAETALHGRAEINVRAGASDMRIRVRGRDGLRFEAAVIYRCLRHALIEEPQTPRVPAVAA